MCLHQWIKLHSVLFLIPHSHSTSSKLSLQQFQQCCFCVLAHPAVTPLVCSSTSLPTPFLYSHFLPLPPSFLPTLWQPVLVRCRLRVPNIHEVQLGRWTTQGLGPLAKTTSPAVAWCLPLLPTDPSPWYLALPPKIYHWIIPSVQTFFCFRFPQPLRT